MSKAKGNTIATTDKGELDPEIKGYANQNTKDGKFKVDHNQGEVISLDEPITSYDKDENPVNVAKEDKDKEEVDR